MNKAWKSAGVRPVRLTKAGRELETCVFDETSYTHPDHETLALGRAILGDRHAVVVMPREPLSAGRYAVTLSTGDQAYDWSFEGPSTSNASITGHAPDDHLTASSGHDAGE